MTNQLLVCLRCGGPLGKVESVPAIVECEFCHSVISVGHGAPLITRESTLDAKSEADRRNARAAFVATIADLAARGRDPFETLRDAAAQHLGTAGQTDTLARIVFALAVDFEAETKASVLRDGIVLNRIAEGYLRLLEELRDAPSAELNLPFLTATSSGPQHLQRTLSPAILAELAQRSPATGAAAVAAPSASPPTKKKRSWWPF